MRHSNTPDFQLTTIRGFLTGHRDGQADARAGYPPRQAEAEPLRNDWWHRGYLDGYPTGYNFALEQEAARQRFQVGAERKNLNVR